MKVTRRQLRQIIKEELNTLSEADPDTNSDGALDAPELRKLADELGGEGQAPPSSFRIPYRNYGYEGRRIISRDRAWLEFVPKGSGSQTRDDMFRAVTLLDSDDPEIGLAMATVHAPKSAGPLESYDVYSVYATTTGQDMKITHRQLRKIIKEELNITLRESIMDTTPMMDLMGTMAGEIADRFGNEMERLCDEDPAMMREQGYTDRSQWSRQVGSAEIQLEETIQNMMAQAVQDIETRLHDGDYYDRRDDVSSMGGRDSNSDGKLDADELRAIAGDLEG